MSRRDSLNRKRTADEWLASIHSGRAIDKQRFLLIAFIIQTKDSAYFALFRNNAIYGNETNLNKFFNYEITTV